MNVDTRKVEIMGNSYVLHNLHYPFLQKKGAEMAETRLESLNEDGKKVVEEINEKGEITKVITEGEEVCESESTVEIFEDRKILARRVTEYVKPIVYKIKTEVLNECGEIVDVIIEELDEGTMNMQTHSVGRSNPAPAPEVQEEPYFSAQSVDSPKTIMPSTPDPQYRFHALSYKDMVSRTRRSNQRFFSAQNFQNQGYDEDCRPC